MDKSQRIGAGIAEKFGYELYDALIVASALEAGCATLCARLASIERQIGGRIAPGKDRGALVIDHVLYSGV